MMGDGPKVLCGLREVALEGQGCFFAAALNRCGTINIDMPRTCPKISRTSRTHVCGDHLSMHELKRSNSLVRRHRLSSILSPTSLPWLTTCRGGDAWDGDEHRKPPPMGVKLTGYRLLNVGVILVFGVTKAALAHCGQLSTLTTLDWVAGASSAIMYVH